MVQPVCVEYSHFGMDTGITYRVYGKQAETAVQAMQAEIQRLEHLLSRYLPHSDIDSINRQAGKEMVPVKDETCEVLSRALMLSQLSKGLFDVAIGPLVALWDYKHAASAPGKTRILETRSLVDYRDLMVRRDGNLVGLRKTGQSIDLGGIGKGYAGSCCIHLLQTYGIVSAFVDLGGNVSTLGSKPDGSPWKVGIRHPRHTDSLLGALDTSNTSVVTSGDYERYFEDAEGNRWHHILNPTTGYPAQSGLMSVTVVCRDSWLADALSTAVFVAGMEAGLELLSHFSGTEAVLVDDHLQVFITQGLTSSFRPGQGVDVSMVKG